MQAAVAWSRRHVRALVIAGVALLVSLTVAAFISWHFSSMVLVPDHSAWPTNVTVEGVAPQRIVLSRSEDSERPGWYGLDWQAGHAIVGPVLTSNSDTITRMLGRVRGYLAPGLKVAVDPHVYVGNPRQARGLRFSSVDIDGELGPLPVWLIPGRSHTWAIVVHGINSDPQIGLRIAPELHRLRLPALLITYRDDLGAPPSPDGLHHMGLTEWRDLAASVHYALRHGARRVVLIGYSMGGALISQFMERSSLSNRVAALILDAPALDWESILEFNAERMSLPGFLALPVEWAIDARINPDWNSLNALAHPEDFHLPILLFHGKEDKVVPLKTSEEFANELPNWVTFYAVPKAGHTESWNVAPHIYEHRLEHFLNKSLSGPRRS